MPKPVFKSLCPVTGKNVRSDLLVPLASLRPALAELVLKEYPQFDGTESISRQAVNSFRLKYVRHALEDERGQLGALETQVVQSLEERELLSQDIGKEIEKDLTVGERAADRIASFGGSWTFIILFALILAAWIGLNSWVLRQGAFDPYPYILMNLVLSTIAALQAPLIMMSQNRSASRDRRQADSDYKINLKAELEIRNLHEKMDHLLKQQHTRLMEIQQIQIELLSELHLKPSRTPKAEKSPEAPPA
jgi:uncharacterized membrane protein|uniref:DUF1003 domain-containing protein n=1 Tax=Cephaloticoccus sp. TaxID=1985742 RepID=UPI004049F7BB